MCPIPNLVYTQDSNKTKKDAGCLNLCHSQKHCFYFVPDTICLGKPVTNHNTAGTPDPKKRVHQTLTTAGTPDP